MDAMADTVTATVYFFVSPIYRAMMELSKNGL